MTVFEFVFSLYSLLFGLALAQVFGGFGNTLQERHKIKVGWLTPLAGLFIVMDITSFWSTAWDLKDLFRPDYLYLLIGVLLAGIYYLAARLVFPRNFAEWPDFDVYYFRHKIWIFGGILFCNAIATVVLLAIRDSYLFSPLGASMIVTYYILLIGLLVVRSKRASLALLLLMMIKYAVFPLLYVLGVGTHHQLV